MAAVPGRSDELLERAAQLVVLKEVLAHVGRGGRGAVVMVCGEAGVGKSALLVLFPVGVPPRSAPRSASTYSHFYHPAGSDSIKQSPICPVCGGRKIVPVSHPLVADSGRLAYDDHSRGDTVCPSCHGQ